ncbi:phage tail sheath family protein [Streptomyces sp. HUAS TT7]|uniref:phage tail sheath family protein n=1 Tax=Streptomyces sp. HUAS TT7 TaxID=3447507 RepID=UPI003F659EB7
MSPAPGVYVEEVLGLGLTVPTGLTAVPAFIGDFADVPDGAAVVSSWLDYLDRFPAAKDDATGLLASALRGYFQNGGGRCYLVSTSGRTLEAALADVEKFPDVTMLVAPGLWDQGAETAGRWAQALTEYAAGHQAMAILHVGRDHTPEQAKAVAEAWNLDGRYAAVYHPWLLPAGGGSTEAAPPSPVAAATWCRSDAERGVWKAPANITLRGYTPLQSVSDTQHEEGQPVNFIREFRGAGTVAWGARTMAAEDDRDSRYIPVRRLLNSVERDVTAALRFTIFEPNTQATWERAGSAIETYLHNIWHQGGLQGNSPEQGYFVQIGEGITMNRDDIAAGRLIVKIGLAALRPAEFIILQFTQEVGQG